MGGPGRGRSSRPSLAIPSANGSMRTAMAATTCSKSRPAASRGPAHSRQAASSCTTIDNALTRPWTVTKKYERERNNVVWHFNHCAENNHHVWIGKDNYMVSGDGYLMPVRKNQAPPDLHYFKQTQ